MDSTLAHLIERKNRIQIQSGSFFDKVPENGDVYIMKNILHDWDDETSGIILKNIYKSMAPHAKLLIIEFIFKSDNKPSYGKVMDIQMLISTSGGKERSVEEYALLLSNNGFTLNKVIPTLAPFSILEAIRKD